MQVLIAGGHGQIAMLLTPMLRLRGDDVRSLIRNPDHAADLESDGGVPVLCDLERDDVRAHAGGADAIVFAAGAGPGSGPERKRTVDLGGAVRCVEAARANGIRRYVMVSTLGADPHASGEGMAVYNRAKGRADAALAASGLDYTILKPGRLTNDRGTGRVRVGEDVERGAVSREDVAAVIAATLHEPGTVGRSLGVVAGEDEVQAALASLAA